MAAKVPAALAWGWGLSLRSCLGQVEERARPGGAEEGESWALPPLPSVAGGKETTMYFWTLPETGGLGAAWAPETSFTSGWLLETVVVTGEVDVPAEAPLSVITCAEEMDSVSRGAGAKAKLPPPPPPRLPRVPAGKRRCPKRKT